jgi:glycosyltransferase involved in cell wall biosynthesis
MKKVVTKMKVCFVTQEIPPIFINGGAGTATLGYSEEIAGNPEFEVTVLYTSFSFLGYKEKELIVRDFKNKSIELHFLEDLGPENLWNRSSASKSLSILLYLQLNDFNIVHFNDFDGLAFYSVSAKRSGLYLNRTNINIICHGNSRWGLEVSKTLPTQHVLDVFDLERLSLIYADSVMSPSQYLLNWMLENGIQNRSINLLQRNIMPIDRSSIPVDDSVAHSEIKKIVFFGRHEVRKGLFIFLNSINRILRENLDLEVYFLGKTQVIEGEDSADIISRSLIEHKGRVKVLGPLSREEVRAFISTADVLTVMPSIAENLPFTVYECLKWNVKFIASNSGGTSEFFRKGLKDDRLFDPNANALYSKLKEVLVKEEIEVGGLAVNDIDSRISFQKFHQDYQAVPTQPSLSKESFPTVTIALISHNRTNYLKQALSALAAQSIFSFEVIVVDDGSYLRSHLDYLREIKNSTFSFPLRILRTEDIGLGNARNFAADFSDSKYIIFLDDDNVPTPKFIENLVLAAENSDSDAVVAFANTFSSEEDPSGEVDYENLIYFPIGESIYSGILKNNYGDSQGLWKRESFLSLGGFENSGLPAEDWHLYAKACLNGKRILVAPFVGYFYRQHSNSMTARITSSREYKHRVVEIYSEKFGPFFAPFLGLAANEHTSKAPIDHNVRSAIENMSKSYTQTQVLVSRVLKRLSKGVNQKSSSNVSLFRKFQITLRYYGFKRLSLISFKICVKLLPAFFRIRVVGKSINRFLLNPVLDAPRIIGGQYFYNPNNERYEVSLELFHLKFFRFSFRKQGSTKEYFIEPGLNMYPILDLFKEEITAETFLKARIRIKPSDVDGFIWLL